MPRGLEVSERDVRQRFRPPTPDRLDLLTSYYSRALHGVHRPHHGMRLTRGLRVGRSAGLSSFSR